MRLTDHEFNRLTVLRHMRAAQPVSRTDLASLSGLTGGTITQIVRELVQRGMVMEQRVETGGRGRPRVNLSINPQGAYAVGATLTAEGPFLVDIIDLNGNCVSSTSTMLRGTQQLADLADQISGVLRDAIAASPVAHDAIAMVGIGLPAVLDNRTGTVLMLETFEPGPYPFADAIARQLGVPVRLDNSINLLARAMHWFDDGSDVDDFTLVVLDLGLGAACYQNGQLVIGSHGIEAELGHTKIVPENGRRCQCGALGCLQAYSAISGIVGQHCDAHGLAEPSYLVMRDAVAEMVQRARAGDIATQGIFRRAGHYLGIGLANHINMQDPDRILILSQHPEIVSLISEALLASLAQNVLPHLWDQAKLAFGKLDALSYSRGAAAMVLERLYQAREPLQQT
ncbi:MAG: ROK family transcriptional regulator [Sphingomonadales bacterium]|nr:ROK family transcriptional regulator [Sphingomonadales bacterium]